MAQINKTENIQDIPVPILSRGKNPSEKLTSTSRMMGGDVLRQHFKRNDKGGVCG